MINSEFMVDYSPLNINQAKDEIFMTKNNLKAHFIKSTTSLKNFQTGKKKD